jgi:hypothetical protein
MKTIGSFSENVCTKKGRRSKHPFSLMCVGDIVQYDDTEGAYKMYLFAHSYGNNTKPKKKFKTSRFDGGVSIERIA